MRWLILCISGLCSAAPPCKWKFHYETRNETHYGITRWTHYSEEDFAPQPTKLPSIDEMGLRYYARLASQRCSDG